MMSCHLRSRFGIAILSFGLPVVACTASGGGTKTGSTGASSVGGQPAGTSTGSTTTSGLGGNIGFYDGGTGTGGDSGHISQCDDAGNCTCINIASLGHEGVWGPCSSDSTTAFQTWLNTQSTAKVVNYDSTKPTLTPAFLAQYDVILLQWMVATGMQGNDGAAWVFTPQEVSALKDWVNNGGGLIALAGYQCNSQGCTIYDTTAVNQLLSFTDIQFDSSTVLDPSKYSCQDCYCWGGPIPLGGPVTGAPNVGMWDQSSPIGAHINDIGAYDMRPIHSTTATVDCTDGTTNYVVHEQIGKGHVVAYGDEWVTYSGEWLGTAACLNQNMFTNPNDPCYQKSAAQVFQIPQFWYNVIKYAASSVQCFTIMGPGITK
jgi:hypothetical protein